MFHFPEPLPVDFILTDVRPSYLSDGLFFNGAKPGPTHKCVAKQLRPVKRKPNDPVPPIAELDERVLEARAVRGKAFYADTRSGGVDARDLHNALRSLRAADKKFLTDRKIGVTIFPRSTRYEYRHAKHKNRKIDDSEIWTIARRSPVDFDASSLCRQSREISSQLWLVSSETCATLFCIVSNWSSCRLDADMPFWWKPETPGEHCLSSPIELPCDRPGADPSVRLFNKDRRVVTEIDENNDDDNSSRWRPAYRTTDLPKTEAERTKGMSELLRPYLHELDTWYSNNRTIFKGGR